MMDVNDIRGSARMAGNLVRYHSWPTLRQQSIAHHTWNVMRIYRELWGPLSSGVCDMALYHDAGELNAVDAAHDLKANRPELKRICDELEEEGLRKIDAPEWADRVSLQEKLRFKACDLLEMAEFAAEEQEMGNQLMQPVTYNIEHALTRHLGRMEAEGFAPDSSRVRLRVHNMNRASERKGGFAAQIVLDGADRR